MGQHGHLPNDPGRLTTCGFTLHNSLGSLIKDYRKWHQVSQETLAELIGISIRELKRWETDRLCARIDNPHDFSEITGTPMEVCISLDTDQPIWYALGERWFIYLSIGYEELTMIVTDKLLEYLNNLEKIFYKV